jgi:hypothetical protein
VRCCLVSANGLCQCGGMTAHETHGSADATWMASAAQAGTEPAGTGKYNNFYPKEGHFACGACEAPLYSATSKFKDSGWIAFDKCFHTADGACNVGVKPDFGACCSPWQDGRSQAH